MCIFSLRPTLTTEFPLKTQNEFDATTVIAGVLLPYVLITAE